MYLYFDQVNLKPIFLAIYSDKCDYVAELFGNIARSQITMMSHDDNGNGDDDYQE